MAARKRVRKVTKLRSGESLRVRLPRKGTVVVRGPSGVEVTVETEGPIDARASRRA